MKQNDETNGNYGQLTGVATDVKPFSDFNIDKLQYPVLLSVPHAGRVYPQAIMDNLAVPAKSLLRLEDRYADRLITGAVEAGFAAIVAHKPRAWIDLNRSCHEIDPEMVIGLSSKQVPKPSRKVRGGLGLVPRRLTGVGNLWHRKWSWESLERRIDTCHEPYHRHVSGILQKIRLKFGCAMLLDVHSMPPLDHPDDQNSNPQIIIGDRFGRSAGSRFSELAMGHFSRAGLRSTLNHPYAGGYILERHSAPDNNIHAIQLEIDRSCYLDGSLQEPGAGLSAMIGHVAVLAEKLADQINGQFLLAAAE
ncbi:N-formylglutamate amidohydrolase [Parasphingorhabdus halotolerans]|nr:N-formylglutamate amidohydrolase [Parasphingorhabdus halotolerans]